MAFKSFDLPAELERGNTRENRDRIARWVGKDEERFEQLMDLYLHGAWRTAQLAAGVVGICAEEQPELMDPWLPTMVKRMQEPGVHDAIPRTAMRTLQFVTIPPRIAGRVAKVCFDALEDISRPIAVRVFAMTVLVRLCEDQPDLSREVRTVIEAMLPYSTAAFAARARRELKRLGAGKKPVTEFHREFTETHRVEDGTRRSTKFARRYTKS